MKTLLIFSGGADSTTLLYWLVNEGHEVRCISFDYGQRHNREIMSARNICEINDIPHETFDLSGYARLARSALFDDEPVPYGHYHEEQMKKTVVPNRNMIMLSIAAGVAISQEMDAVAIGAHAGDHTIYPDCRPEFLKFVETAIWSGNWGNHLRVLAPFVNKDKTEIIRIGKALKVPYNMTWTCYEGGREPCGKCGACVERDEAFRMAS